MAVRIWIWVLLTVLLAATLGGCLYRVTPPADTPVAANLAPPVTIEPPAPPAVVPSPEPTAAPTETPVPDPAASRDGSTAVATLLATVTVTATVNLTPTAVPTLVAVQPISHTLIFGESLSTIVSDFALQRLNRRLTELEVQAGVLRLLDDPVNVEFRARPSLVFPGQVVSLTRLIAYVEELRGRATPPPDATAGRGG